MRAFFEAESHKEAKLIRRGLDDPRVRAFVKVMGVLLELPSDRARIRVLNYVADRAAEEACRD